MSKFKAPAFSDKKRGLAPGGLTVDAAVLPSLAPSPQSAAPPPEQDSTFNPPKFSQGRVTNAPPPIQVDSLSSLKGGGGGNQNVNSLASSLQAPKTPERQVGAGAAANSVNSTKVRSSGKGLPLRKGGRASSPVKEKFLKDRTEIVQELAKLKEAQAADWAQYAMLRNPIEPEDQLGAPKKKKPQKKKEQPEEITAKTIVAGLKKGGEWDLDPSENRHGEADLKLDDPRFVAAPAWSRVANINRLSVLAEKEDAEVIAAGVNSLKDSQGIVRVASLQLLQKLGKRGDRVLLHSVMNCSTDKVAKVRRAVCHCIQELAERGLPPSRVNMATFTSRDVDILKRDKEAIGCLEPMLDDDVGFVRTAAQEALDKINPGWQRFQAVEERWDDSNVSLRPTRPLQNPVQQESSVAAGRDWNASYTWDDLIPEKIDSRLNAREYVGSMNSGVEKGHDPRYTHLGGYKYNSYNDALRQDRLIHLFEKQQQKAAKKVEMESKYFGEAGSRKITTEWCGIEWVDRTQRTRLGKTIHPKGAGVLPGRDVVAAPYSSGYNGFSVPLGYAYI